MGEPGSSDRQLETWISLARAGDEEAINRLIEHCRPRVLAHVQRQMGARARRWTEAEDVVQRVLIEAVRQLSTLPPRAGVQDLLARMYRTAGFRVLDAARSHRRDVGESVLPEPGQPHGRREPSMGAVTGADYRRWLEGLVARLPPKYAEVVRLCSFEELTCVEAARRLDLKPDTVRKRYEVARRALDRRLSGRLE